jgi:hypothetical protein
MIRTGIVHPVCAILIGLLAAPAGFGQSPAAAQAPAVQASPAVPLPPGSPLTIVILEGNKVVNSISLLQSTAAAIEVRDSNDFPVEGASVTFTLPAQEPGGTFAAGGKTFVTRSDARGQAIAPLVVPAGAGNFNISVSAVLGDRKGSALVAQRNAMGSYVGPQLPPRAWYKKPLVWVALIGTAAAVTLAITYSHSHSGPNQVSVTPGTPIFQ